uniref:Putative secreted protein n=1 Tax=Ixodes ricinus TaxID=34613 RepID=A0A6B0UDL6_IXORI
MLIYTLQHLVNVLLKRLLHSVLWQPTTLCFLLVVHVKCHPHAEADALPHSAHVLRPHCCVYVQFISTLPPSARTAGSTSVVAFSRGALLYRTEYAA